MESPRFPSHLSLFAFLSLFLFLGASIAQECDANKHCATGCCSKFGFCGTTPDHCGAGCQSTCDFKLGCDANNPCKDGSCCNKFGFCGLGPDYCGTTCVTGCLAKSYCDPGYGPQWSEVAKCPLNVCCSKWGYCGMTEEFCGTKQVARPSCSSKNPIERVVGYYEGWATGRPCDAFTPEQIPMGVYSHLNFAFASIDPVTFQIVPASSRDPALYRRLTSLKRLDPGLKVYIAIGGWAFNDPGPTATTFSDLAASESNQRAFISSLISFLNTYDFDGVDIDWEYPEAPDRSGRGIDFANFPVFIKNIQMALAQNGARNGLSITLPASYWYLQHFDIVKLANYVEFFNIMSYDLHGTWDTPQSWLGNHLNSHTNLTEIADALDLLWRNNIPPEKVTLGLAFYSRTFTASDPGCMNKGCLFDSGAPAGACSGQAGVLTNSEISRLMQNTGATPTLDQDAAVEILKVGRDWITFDDERTWDMKINFARSQCLGGVMVWAVSHDRPDGFYSLQLQQATGWKSPRVIPFGSALIVPNGPDPNVPREQCRWMNCGEACPAGWQLVRRRDPYSDHNPEYMFDNTGCALIGGGSSRPFCCPPGPEPRCGWFYHNGGKCNDECPSSFVPVSASYRDACYNGKSQVACCQTTTPEYILPVLQVDGMQVWKLCDWFGSEPNCGRDPSLTDSVCNWDSQRPFFLLGSYYGSGGKRCKDFRSGTKQPSPFCCSAMSPNLNWKNCEKYDSYGNVPMFFRPDAYCGSGCPPGKIKVALDNVDDHCEYGGLEAWCCDAHYENEPRSPGEKDQVIGQLLRDWVTHPTCPADRDPFNKRWMPTVTLQQNGTRALAARDVDNSAPAVAHNILRDTLRIDPGSDEGIHNALLWDSNITPVYGAVSMRAIYTFLIPFPAVKNIVLRNVNLAADFVLCHIQGMQNYLASHATPPTMTCPIVPLLSEADPDLFLDPDDGGDDYGDEDYQDTMASLLDGLNHKLDKRIGHPRRFLVGRDTNDAFWIESQPYINGDNGHNLERANGDSSRYVIVGATNDCIQGVLDDDPDDDDDPVNAEHVIELRTGRMFLDFASGITLPARPHYGIPEARNPNSPVPLRVWRDYFVTGFPEWNVRHPNETPMQRFFNNLGSVTNPFVMLNLEAPINGMKSRIWGLNNLVSDDRWNNRFAQPTSAHGQRAGAEINMIYGTWEYLRSNDVHQLFLSIHEDQIAFFNEFERLLGDHLAGQGQPRPVWRIGEIHWRDFMRIHVQRMELYTQNWLRPHLENLYATWTERLFDLLAAEDRGQPAQPAEVAFALEMLDYVITRQGQIDTIIRSPFTDDL